MRINELLNEQDLQEGMWRNVIGAAALLASSAHLLPDTKIDTSKAAPPPMAVVRKTVSRDTGLNNTVQKIAARYKVDPKLIQNIAKTATKYAYKDFPTAKDILGVIGTE